MQKLKGIIPIFILIAAATVLLGASAIPATASGAECGSSSDMTDGSGLTIKKIVYCEKERTWNWKLLKSADVSEVVLTRGQVLPVNYAIQVNASVEDSAFAVNGFVIVRNLSQTTMKVQEIQDSLGAVSCTESGEAVDFPLDLVSDGRILCEYSGVLDKPATENIAKVLYGEGKSLTATAAINWDAAAVTTSDDCARVIDPMFGLDDLVCDADQSYQFTIDLVYDQCGDDKIVNTASLLTNDTNTELSATWVVDVSVPCDTGCSLTPGYWKTHSVYGPAAYDDTWAQVGEDSLFYLSGLSYYEALWTAPKGNPYFILAHAYIAAELNQLNGAEFSAAQDAFDAATALFQSNSPGDVDGLKGAQKHTWTDLATILDDYNNGLIGPGHCTE